jgi:hypothetical protein
MSESMIKLNEQMDCLKVKLKYAEDWKQIKDLTAQLNNLRMQLKTKADEIRSKKAS